MSARLHAVLSVLRVFLVVVTFVSVFDRFFGIFHRTFYCISSVFNGTFHCISSFFNGTFYCVYGSFNRILSTFASLSVSAVSTLVVVSRRPSSVA